MKKRFMLFLVSFLVIILTACSYSDNQNIIFSKTSEDYGDTGGLPLPLDINNTEIDIMLVSETEELSDSLIIKELSKRTGLKINISSVLPSVANRQTQLLISTNDIPDIMKTTDDLSEINNLGMKGSFVPVNKYLNELPNFRRVFIENDKYSHVMDDSVAYDGNLYFYPSYECEKELTHGFLYRKDIFDKNNIALWNNKDEFHNALKTLKEIYPDSTPYVSQSGTDIFNEWSYSFGFSFPGMFYDEEESVWKYSGCNERFKEMLEFMKMLYDEELIDKTFLTTSSYVWDWKIKDENGFVTYASLAEMTSYDESDNFDLDYAKTVGNYFRVKRNSLVGTGPSIANNKNSLLSLKLMDYLLSPSGIELTTLGIMNQTYEYNNGEVLYNGVKNAKKDMPAELCNKYGLFIPGLYRSVDKRSPYLTYTSKEINALEVVRNNNGFIEEIPEPEFNEEEKQLIEETLAVLDGKAYQYASNFILGHSDMTFDEWILDVTKNGVKEIETIYNK